MSFDERFEAGAPRAVASTRSTGIRLASVGPAHGGATGGVFLSNSDVTGGIRMPDKEARKEIAPAARLASAPPTATGSLTDVRSGPSPAGPGLRPYEDGRTAIYDITARTVYLPSGRRLEAHSGLGRLMDDPRHAHVRMRGVTPPNVYNLSLRERLFHGVRAIRLNPVDQRRMRGRDGMLAHTYMLGPSGQSNGCVAFKNYPEFLNAFLKGEIARLVVVERLDEPPGPKLASGWLPEAARSMFKTTDGESRYSAATER